MRWKRAVLIVAIGSAVAAAPSVGAGADAPMRFPAAGVPLEPLLVRSQPDTSSRIVRRLPRFRADHQFQIVLALSSRRRANGARWYLLSLPGRPNGAQGWVPADAVDVRSVANRIIVRLASRRIEVRRVADGAVARAKSAADPKSVGVHGAQTIQQCLDAGVLDEIHIDFRCCGFVDLLRGRHEWGEMTRRGLEQPAEAPPPERQARA
jgi:hypothetical protein